MTGVPRVTSLNSGTPSNGMILLGTIIQSS